MIKILIVDDHGLVRTGIKRLLSDVPGFKVVGEAACGEEAIKLARQEIPDVVLMDVKMPGIGGIEATRKLLRINPDLRVLVLSALNEEPFPTRLLQAGATGYLTKGCDREEVIHAIKAVYSGQRYLNSEIAQSMALKYASPDNATQFDKLSEREMQVMYMITQGLKVSDISQKLKVTSKTVNSYRYRIFEKLKIHSDVELTHLALRHGLIEANYLNQSDDAKD